MFEGMNKELVQDWLAILRDPNSKQAHNRLCNGERGKCCLGHLLDAMYDRDPDRWREFNVTGDPLPQRSGSNLPIYHDNNRLAGALDGRNLEISGLTGSEQYYLSSLNDTALYSLSQIAAFVEEGRAWARTKEGREFHRQEIAAGIRTCSKCGLTMPLDEFYKRTDSSPFIMAECKTCFRARIRRSK